MLRWSPSCFYLPLLVLVTLCLLVVPPSAGASSQSDGLEDGQTVFRVELDSSGDAHWQVTERIPLTDEQSVEAFDTVAETFESGGYDLRYPEEIVAAARAVDRSTDREMRVTTPDRTGAVEGTVGNRTGLLTVLFTWENFARVGESDNLYIDDVLETDRGLWLPELLSDQRLTLQAPDGYAVLDASVPPENGSLHWEGPTEFDPGTLAATFVGDGDSPNGTDDSAGDDSSENSTTGLLWVALTGVGVAAVTAMLMLYREQIEGLLDRSPAPEGEESATDGGAEPAAGRTDTETAPDPPETTADKAPVPGEGASDPDNVDDIDEELLSDEERVERLLDRNGGRMKQANIVEETGWSNAKVSQLLSSMAEEDRIDKLRIGRENLISFPDVDVTDPDGNP